MKNKTIENFFIKTSFIKRADILLFIALIALGLTMTYFAASGQTGTDVVVKVDGKIYGTYDLHKDQVVTIRENHHVNKIIIKNGTVQMAFSNCRNQNCVHQGRIHNTSQAIVCLPNRVTVEIQGGKGFDAISN